MDSDIDDDNIHFGTPLEPLKEGAGAKRRPPVPEEQTVRDGRGRQRFHGAFAGGFSAGFFNTVGSKDGFQPASFVSSRSKRADRYGARPDDFMDDEDRGDHGIAPQRVQARSEFRETSSGSVKRKHARFDECPIPGEPVFSQLVKPVRDTVGVRILKSMGWRPGQGIGPRITRKEKKRQRKVYGCARPPGSELVARQADPDTDSDSGSDSDHALREVLLAPDDSEAPLALSKHDRMGLGYRGLDRRSVLGLTTTTAAATLRYRDKAGKLAIRGQAFGVGAFEEEDDDIYGAEDMSNYDFESAPERPAASPAPAAADRLARTLSGFRPSESSRLARRRYPSPTLPVGFDPLHRARASRFEPLPDDRRGLARHRLSAGHRANLIGEERLLRATGAGLSPAAQAQTKTEVQSGIQAAASDATAPCLPAGSQLVSTGTELAERMHQSVPPATLAVITESCITAPQTARTFRDAQRLKDVLTLLAESADPPTTAAPAMKPFAHDSEKQARYEQFLKLSAANREDDYRLLLPTSMTDWERQREVSEFKRSALIFRPLTASLAERFVSAGTSERQRPEVAAVTGPAGPSDPTAQAARRKMFGMLTRRKQEWHPVPLLCRRFNVKYPFPHSSIMGTPGPTSADSPVSSAELALHPRSPATEVPAATAQKPWPRQDDMFPEGAGGEGLNVGTSAGTATTPAAMLASPASEPIATQPGAPLQKPPADLFKAIFDNSDTDSEAEVGPGEEADSPGTPSLTGSSQWSVTPSKPVPVTPAVTPHNVTGGLPPSAAGEGAARPGPTSHTKAESGAAFDRPTAAPFDQAPPPAAAKLAGFRLFDNIDLDELNSWKRDGGGGGGNGSHGDGCIGGSDSNRKSVDVPVSALPVSAPNDTCSDDEYGPCLPSRQPAGSSCPPVACVGRQGSTASDDGEWRERSPAIGNCKKHKKSKKKKKCRKRNSDSDSSEPGDLDETLFRKIRDVVMKKKKKKKSSFHR